MQTVNIISVGWELVTGHWPARLLAPVVRARPKRSVRHPRSSRRPNLLAEAVSGHSSPVGTVFATGSRSVDRSGNRSPIESGQLAPVAVEWTSGSHVPIDRAPLRGGACIYPACEQYSWTAPPPGTATVSPQPGEETAPRCDVTPPWVSVDPVCDPHSARPAGPGGRGSPGRPLARVAIAQPVCASPWEGGMAHRDLVGRCTRRHATDADRARDSRARLPRWRKAQDESTRRVADGAPSTGETLMSPIDGRPEPRPRTIEQPTESAG